MHKNNSLKRVAWIRFEAMRFGACFSRIEAVIAGPPLSSPPPQFLANPPPDALLVSVGVTPGAVFFDKGDFLGSRSMQVKKLVGHAIDLSLTYRQRLDTELPLMPQDHRHDKQQVRRNNRVRHKRFEGGLHKTP